MKFKDLHPPILELAPGQTFHRVQLTRARKTSVRINGLLLAPTGLKSGRFCLQSEPTAYLADSEHTALYESIFRRDVHSRSLDELARKSLVTFTTKGRLRLADVRALAEPYPCFKPNASPLPKPLRKSAERSNWTASSMHQPNTPCMRALHCLRRAWRS
jgi:hypothetical protein